MTVTSSVMRPRTFRSYANYAEASWPLKKCLVKSWKAYLPVKPSKTQYFKNCASSIKHRSTNIINWNWNQHSGNNVLVTRLLINVIVMNARFHWLQCALRMRVAVLQTVSTFAATVMSGTWQRPRVLAFQTQTTTWCVQRQSSCYAIFNNYIYERYESKHLKAMSDDFTIKVQKWTPDCGQLQVSCSVNAHLS